MYRLGVDIGGTKINIGLFDAETKNIIANKKGYLSEITDICEYIKNTTDYLCKQKDIKAENIVSCGIGIPGTVSNDGKKILKVPNISILTEDIATKLENLLNIPVRVIQDSRAAAWGEYMCGGAQGAKSVVCVTLGTGIGTGIVVDGKIYDGALGCAGEIGHLPIEENGRKCGCGKYGCLEKYCAGGGLDITAAELFGEGKTASYLFEQAQKGQENAINVISDAVQMLGRGLVSIVNLLSPEYLMLSGGLCEQEKLYLDPVIDYIKQHCYVADRLPVIKKAELGELSPLYGAAFIPMPSKKKASLSASIMCADVLNLGSAIKEIEEAGIEYLHCDIMDNHFVPNLMMPMEFLNKLRPATDMPFDFHIMAENPDSVIQKLILKPGDIVSVHVESTVHLQKTITLIKEMGAKASVALNPATPISAVEEVLPQLDMVLVMTVNPGFAGQKIVENAFDKISRVKQVLSDKGLDNILIQVDGNCSFQNIPKMHQAGADIFVVGTSSVFSKDMSIKQATQKVMNLL